MPGVYSNSDSLRASWRKVQYLVDLFWKRWLRSYFPTLQARTKWTTEKEDLKVGELVLLYQESLPKLSWPLGRIVEVYPGKDGHVRSSYINKLIKFDVFVFRGKIIYYLV